MIRKCHVAVDQVTKISNTIDSCISGTHHFIPVAVETLGPICSEGASFLSEIAEKLSRTTGEQREKSFLFQRISVAIQRGNAAAFHGTLTSFSVNTLAI